MPSDLRTLLSGNTGNRDVDRLWITGRSIPRSRATKRATDHQALTCGFYLRATRATGTGTPLPTRPDTVGNTPQASRAWVLPVRPGVPRARARTGSKKKITPVPTGGRTTPRRDRGRVLRSAPHPGTRGPCSQAGAVRVPGCAASRALRCPLPSNDHAPVLGAGGELLGRHTGNGPPATGHGAAAVHRSATTPRGMIMVLRTRARARGVDQYARAREAPRSFGGGCAASVDHAPRSLGGGCASTPHKGQGVPVVMAMAYP